MTGPIDLDKKREEREDAKPKYIFTAMAICLAESDLGMPCFYRWIAGVEPMTSLFRLECPQCHAQDSFAAVVPSEYLEHFK